MSARHRPRSTTGDLTREEVEFGRRDVYLGATSTSLRPATPWCMKTLIATGTLLILCAVPTLTALKDTTVSAPAGDRFAVLAYYAGTGRAIDGYPVEKLTHIIFSFLHWNGQRLAFDNARDSAEVSIPGLAEEPSSGVEDPGFTRRVGRLCAVFRTLLLGEGPAPVCRILAEGPEGVRRRRHRH
jgi:hypothetical protein